LAGPGITHMTLSGNNSSRIFHVLPGKTLILKDLSLKNATAPTNGGAIFVEGGLTLDNILLQNNFENGIHKGLTVVSPAGVVQMVHSVQVKQ